MNKISENQSCQFFICYELAEYLKVVLAAPELLVRHEDLRVVAPVHPVQGSAKRWAQGCVNPASKARQEQEEKSPNLETF